MKRMRKEGGEEDSRDAERSSIANDHCLPRVCEREEMLQQSTMKTCL